MSSVMLGTTLLVFLVMLVVWETRLILALAYLLIFSCIDMVYLSGMYPGPAMHSCA